MAFSSFSLGGIRDGTVISCHCPPHTPLRLGASACAVILDGGKARLHIPAPDEVFFSPDQGTCCIVSLNTFRLTLGMKELIGYHAAGAPGHLFQLGFFGEITLKVAHIRGLSLLLRRSSDITVDTLFPMLGETLRPVMIEAFQSVLGSQPVDYQEILAQRAQLQVAAEKALFWALYPLGLCVKPHSFSIKGFSKPML
ncbi:MAG: hypothetical protein IJ381_08855 [Clostridia bacterium]|nr:hypothetical protein [Clostridia bacterium]